MILTSSKAMEYLENARGGDEGWINHSICVGNTAAIIAKELNLDRMNKVLEYVISTLTLQEILKMI